MARARTTKSVAQRIDLNYFKRATPFKRARLWLSILAPALALLWTGYHLSLSDYRAYSSGRLSQAHAVLEKECAACHLQHAGGYRAESTDSACLACHDGPSHHTSTGGVKPGCRDCHTEHRGRLRLADAPSQSCAECHANLRVSNKDTQYSPRIRSLEDGHPEFLALRASPSVTPHDPGTLKFNHALHMMAIRRGPNGPTVQLACSDCHRPAASQGAQWEYGDAAYVAAPLGYKPEDQTLPIRSRGLAAPRPATGRERMAPPTFAKACAGCHLLTFDKRFDEGAPHDTPQAVDAQLLKKYSAYIATHPGELREVQDPQRMLAGQASGPSSRTLSAAQWVKEQTAVAEQLLWHKTCVECHRISATPLADVKMARWDAAAAEYPQTAASGAGDAVVRALPAVAPADTTLEWLPHARFDHDAHRGFSCTGCHQQALKSRESQDILIPGIAVCRTCHAPGPGYASPNCSECHTYHDWAQRTEVKPAFTLPALREGR